MSIPLPQHPRPDFERKEWLNLNGTWKFKFDKENVGKKEAWFNSDDFPLDILVPFGWGSPLSGVKDEADYGWYRKAITIPEEWKGKRVFLVVGASDWITEGWFDGAPVGFHEGGYTPFEFELTHLVKWGVEQKITIRAEDTTLRSADSPCAYALFGKQGYGNVNGIWQTVYLEARPDVYMDTVHLIPDIDKMSVTAKITLDSPAKQPAVATIHFKKEDRKAPASTLIKPGQQSVEFEIPFEAIKLWDLDNPYLYEVQAVLTYGDNNEDRISTYFGMRKVSVTKMPGTGYPYVALNNKPIYLQLTLDQSYHPEGYYTFPSDEFMKNEIMISKKLALSGNRVHIKVEIPRKLYWADKLGLLIMADVPNSWGQPTQQMFAASEYAMREMLKRDMNHPCIFSWVLYNETWGLFTDWTEGGEKRRKYLPQTQQQVARMVRLAKSLDPSRLVEDNSACNNDHVLTDINTWHSYLPGYDWEKRIHDFCESTFEGSTWNYIGGHRQTDAPMFNSECGNVWGYAGSTGDVDWSWDYHMMMNAFRRHPKCAGWLYTEHHDVCNEWNGYVRFDRTAKYTGIEQIFPGMSLNDLHADAYLALDSELCRSFEPGAKCPVPLFISLTTDKYMGRKLSVTAVVRWWDEQGKLTESPAKEVALSIDATAWMHADIGTVNVQLPNVPAVGAICFSVKNGAKIIARNFTTFVTVAEKAAKDGVIRVSPKDFTKAKWSQKQWNIFDGLKVNGAGKGFFEYEFKLPAKADKAAVFRAEISAKRLNGKDIENDKVGTVDMDHMLGKGFHDPSKNANSYPMTDTDCWSGTLRVYANGKLVHTNALPDDPADHRGILSWFAQPHDRKLNEAGSYGYLVEAAIPEEIIAKAKGKLTIRLETDDHGLAIYGAKFGRFPLDLTLSF